MRLRKRTWNLHAEQISRLYNAEDKDVKEERFLGMYVDTEIVMEDCGKTIVLLQSQFTKNPS